MSSFLLASASPRRRELFSHVSADFIAVSQDVDESKFSSLSPRKQCMATAAAKAKAAAGSASGRVVIGCDTVVALRGRVFGKPHSREQAAGMLRALSGRTHSVYTGVCIISGNAQKLFCVKTRVTFYPIAESEIERCCDTPEPYDKAGGYGIQDTAAAWVKGIRGCYYNVMGLPIASLREELKKMSLL